MGYSEDSKSIRVGAVFKGASIVPKWFIWDDRKYTVKEVNYVWLDRRGQEKIYCFAVSDGTNNYKLSFNAEKAVWQLDKISEGG